MKKDIKNLFAIMMVAILLSACKDRAFPIVGWDSWGGITVAGNPTQQVITITGEFQGAPAGYVIERELDFGGKTLTLNISNSSNSLFDHYKLLKLEANGRAIYPNEAERNNLNDQDYINSGDGVVSFLLPSPLYKLEFVFWNAKLNALSISGTLK